MIKKYISKIEKIVEGVAPYDIPKDKIVIEKGDTTEKLAQKLIDRKPYFEVHDWSDPVVASKLRKDSKWKLIHYIKMYNETGNLSDFKNPNYTKLVDKEEEHLKKLSKTHFVDLTKTSLFDRMKSLPKEKQSEFKKIAEDMQKEINEVRKKYHNVFTEHDFKAVEPLFIEILTKYKNIFQNKGMIT